MRKLYSLITVFLFSVLLFSATPAKAIPQEPDNRPFLHWLWENDHSIVINSQLINSDDQLVKNHESFINLAREYSQRDPLFNVYGARETEANADTDMDAFLMGLKANNLVYVIHVADKNPIAKKWAIADLKLMGKLAKIPNIQKKFDYWASLLEENRLASNRISHMYVHYVVDISEAIGERSGLGSRYNFVLGYLINDFIVAHLINNSAWMKADQEYLANLYSIRNFSNMDRFSTLGYWKFNKTDLKLQGALEEASKKLDAIVKKNTNRKMGDKPYRSNQ